MNFAPRILFNTTASGTQYVTEVLTSDTNGASFVVKHPGSTTTAYSVQVSNATDAEIKAGAGDWADYSGVTIPAKSAAETFYVELTDLPFARTRLKMVTSAGSGTIKINGCGKGGS